VEERRRTIAHWVDEFGHRAYAFARTLTQSDEDARDLVQEAWLVVVEHRGPLPTDDETARAWVFEIVRRLGMNRIRTDKRRRGVLRSFARDVPQPQPIQGPELDRDALVREVMYQIEALPALQRRVLVARLVHGRTIRETAEDLGRAEGTVKGSLARAIGALRSKLGAEWEEALRRAPLRSRPPPEGGGGEQHGEGEREQKQTESTEEKS